MSEYYDPSHLYLLAAPPCRKLLDKFVADYLRFHTAGVTGCRAKMMEASPSPSHVLRHMGVCEEPAGELWADLLRGAPAAVKAPSKGTPQAAALKSFKNLSEFLHDETLIIRNTLLIPDEFNALVSTRTHTVRSRGRAGGLPSWTMWLCHSLCLWTVRV